MSVRFIVALVSVFSLAGCGESPPPEGGWSAERDLGLAWVKHSAEYQALALQAYHQAERALPGFLADRNWTALPGQTNAQFLPPAIIFDVDETVLTGVDFQLSVERPVSQAKLDAWNSANTATATEGFTSFAATASAAGVDLFFITNRPCEMVAGNDDPCPYEQTVIDDIREAGFETDRDHVLLSFERDNWSREKLLRRETLARTHRIVMLIGDDLSDFIPCVRATAIAPCDNAGTAESRKRKVAQFSGYWGNGWYILPNPMHGTWTSFREP